MLATAGPLPTGPGWAYEAKFDGMRALVYSTGDQWRLLTRTGRDATAAVPELAVLPDLVRGRAVVLDGELVSLGPTGVPEFGRLRQRIPVRRPSATLLAAVPVQLYLFDLLHLDDRGRAQAPDYGRSPEPSPGPRGRRRPWNDRP